MSTKPKASTIFNQGDIVRHKKDGALLRVRECKTYVATCDKLDANGQLIYAGRSNVITREPIPEYRICSLANLVKAELEEVA